MKSLPLGNPPLIEHRRPNGGTEIAQRLVGFPFTPPDVKLKDKDALSSSNDWFTKHDKNEIDELGSLDFHASSGPESVGVVPKLHNTSAGIEIYQLPPTSSKETFEKTEGPYRPGITKKYSNKRSGKKLPSSRRVPWRSRVSHVFTCLGCSAILSRCRPQLIGRWMFRSSRKSATRPERPAIRVARKLGLICERWPSRPSKSSSPDGKLVYGSLAQNPRGEDSSPEDYWTVGAIRGHSFYKVLSSKAPVANILNLNDASAFRIWRSRKT